MIPLLVFSHYKIHLIILFLLFCFFFFFFGDNYDLSSAAYLTCQRDVGSSVGLTHTRSVHWPYLCTETHAHSMTFHEENTPGVNSASHLSILLRVSIIHLDRNTFLVILYTFFAPPSASLSLSTCPSPYLCLDRSLSRHWNTNQDFLVVGTGSLVKD